MINLFLYFFRLFVKEIQKIILIKYDLSYFFHANIDKSKVN